MKRKPLLKAAARVVCSLVGASIFYLAWLAAFLVITPREGSLPAVIIWLLGKLAAKTSWSR